MGLPSAEETGPSATRRQLLGATAASGVGATAGCGDRAGDPTGTAVRDTDPGTASPSPSGTHAQHEPEPGAGIGADHDHSGGENGTATIGPDTVSGIQILHSGLDEATVRERVANASGRAGFLVAPDAQWTLTDTLRIQKGTTIIGFDNGASGGYTFKKGFDGTLATVQRHTTLKNLVFHGNRDNYDGDGLNDDVEKLGAREQQFVKITVEYCEGDGRRMRNTYMNHFEKCRFGYNGGYGVRTSDADRDQSTSGHDAQNKFTRCEIYRNGTGGVGIFNYDHTTVYDSCTIHHNGGPAFHHFHEDGNPVNAQNMTIRSTLLLQNGGPAWYHEGGWSPGIQFQNSKLVGNGGGEVESEGGLRGYPNNWKKGYTTPGEKPPGQIHVEDGLLDMELRGGVTYGWDQLYTSSPDSGSGPTGGLEEAREEHNLVLGGAAMDWMQGDIDGPKTLLTVLNPNVLNGEVSVKAGMAYGPRGTTEY